MADETATAAVQSAVTSVQAGLADVQTALNELISAGSQFIVTDLNLAIADAQAQGNNAAVLCWQTILKLNFQAIPTGAGLAYFKQRYLDAAAQYVAVNQNCAAIAPLFVKAYNYFIQQATGLNI